MQDIVVWPSLSVSMWKFDINKMLAQSKLDKTTYECTFIWNNKNEKLLQTRHWIKCARVDWINILTLCFTLFHEFTLQNLCRKISNVMRKNINTRRIKKLNSTSEHSLLCSIMSGPKNNNYWFSQVIQILQWVIYE